MPRHIDRCFTGDMPTPDDRAQAASPDEQEPIVLMSRKESCLWGGLA